MREDLQDAANAFAKERPNAVVMERSAMGESDIQHKQHSAISNLVNRLAPATVTDKSAANKSGRDLQLLKFQSVTNKLVLHSILQLAASYLDLACTQHFLAGLVKAELAQHSVTLPQPFF